MTIKLSVVFVVLTSQFITSQAHTYFQFSRALETCDFWQDNSLSGTLDVVWAYSKNDPKTNDDLQNPFVKGSTKIHLQQAPNELPLEQDTKIAYVRRPLTDVNYGDRKNNINSTYYWDYGVDLWHEFQLQGITVDENHPIHVTKWGVDVTDGNYEYIHHVIISRCPGLATHPEGLGFANSGEAGTAGMEGNDVIAQALFECDINEGDVPLITWVLGMEPQAFSPGVGLKIGGSDGLRYILMGFHYDIPFYDPPEVKVFGDKVPAGWRPDNILRDSSGLKFWFTETLRESDVNQAWIGTSILREFYVPVPPHQPAFLNIAASNKNCWDPLFPPEGEVRITQLFLHGHDHTKKIRMRHIRDGKELPNIIFDPSYNNYYQQWLETDVLWKKGDEMIVECTLDTTELRRTLGGGLTTDEEQCTIMLITDPPFKFGPPEWTADLESREAGMFFSITGTKSVCSNQTYYYPEFEPLKKENSCMRHKDPSNFGDIMIKSTKYEEIDFSKYRSHKILDGYEMIKDRFYRYTGDGKFHLYWSYNEMSQSVDFLVDVDTTGWISFGTKNAHSDREDIFVMYVDDKTGEPFFYDQYKTETFSVDDFQDGCSIRGGQHEAPFFSGVKEVDVHGLEVSNAPQFGVSNSLYGFFVFLSIIGSLLVLLFCFISYVMCKNRNKQSREYQNVDVMEMSGI